MTWPATFDPPTREALVLVPSPAAQVQDLGPFRSGRMFETDILPGSALVCAARDGRPCVGEDGLVLFAFEGNAIGAVNLERYYERCLSAAGRLATRSPSIAYGRAHPENLTVVARFDLLRFVFTGVIDAAGLEAWSGEPVAGFLPPSDLQTPTDDPNVIASLCKLPMRSLMQGESGVFVWMLMDGTILSKDQGGAGALTVWRPGDPGLGALLECAGLDISARMLLVP